MPPTSRTLPASNDRLIEEVRRSVTAQIRLGRLLVALHQRDDGEIQRTLNDLEAT